MNIFKYQFNKISTKIYVYFKNLIIEQIRITNADALVVIAINGLLMLKFMKKNIMLLS